MGTLHRSRQWLLRVAARIWGSRLNCFEANLALLAARQPLLAAHLLETPSNCITIATSTCGLPTAFYEQGASSLALHSRYDPLREARNALKKCDCAGADYFIFLGFGLGYILEALLETQADPSHHYFIIESDLGILKAALEARDLSTILSLPHIHFAWPSSGPALGEQWQGFFDPIQAQKSVFLNHLPSISLNAGLFKAAVETIQSQTFRIFTDINTLVAKSQNFLDNFVHNLPKAAKAPGIVHFAGLFTGLPAVIVSAGPSLDKNIHELRGHDEQILILSTDTALKPLLAAGIDPHFILTGDPSAINYRHLQKAPTREAFLVAEATSFPAVFEEFEKKIIACTFENSSLRALSDLLGNKGTLRAWGSVATMALDFALSLQCNPIVFIGQDLAHTDKRIYCSGVCFDEEWFDGIADPAGWDAQTKKLRAERPALTMEDIFGQPIETTDKLAAYRSWINKTICDHPETRFINATEGGILRENAEILSLRETLHRYCNSRHKFRVRIRNTYEAAQQNNLLYAGISVSTLKGEMAAIQDILELGIRICEMNSTMSSEALKKRLEDTQQSIYYNPHVAPLLDCFNQMGNYTFLRKRHALSLKPLNADLKEEIQNAYLEYFSSVREASARIGKALSHIEAALKL
jgi:hypothetical protein